METIELVNERIAKNLIYYRKASGMTQAEVASKINYSDKSVSKWESGNGVPDIYVLIQLASIFDVTVNDLIGETESKVHAENKKKRNGLHILIMLLSSGIVWLVATLFFVISSLASPGKAWLLAFLFALPVNAILLVVLTGAWKYKFLNFLSVSALIWTLIVACYALLKVLYIEEGFWLLFVLGAPLQILETLWVYFRYKLVRLKDSSMAFLRLKGRKNKRKKNNDSQE